MSIKNDLAAGVAGEHLVCADLILRGYNAFLSDQGLPYDVVADIQGRLIKIQVKTTRGPREVPQREKRTPAYLFHIKKCGKGGKKAYGADDVNLFALVALDRKEIGYLPPQDTRRTLILRTEDHRGCYANEQQSEDVEQIRLLSEKGKTINEIAKLIGTSWHRVARILKGQPFEAGTYLSELTLERALK